MEKDTKTSDILKVVVIGPECTGKSTLSSALAEHYDTCWVREYAREYIDELDRPYQFDDLLEIARGQIALEDRFTKHANKILICDTDLIVIKIWAEYKYGRCHEEILQHIENRHYDLYLLTTPDIPWEDDPQREHPSNRDQLFNIYRQTLLQHNLTFNEISGNMAERKSKAITFIDEFLKKR